MHVWLVHGYNASQGENTIDRMKPFLQREGFRVKEFNYKWLNGPVSGLFGAQLLNAHRASEFGKQALDAGPAARVAVGHSNGGAILYRLMVKDSTRFDQWHLINPALDNDVEFPAGANVTVYYTPGEMPTKLASYIPFTLWGDMGSVGYRGKSPVANINTASPGFGLHASYGHSDKFADNKVAFWSGFIANRIRNGAILRD